MPVQTPPPQINPYQSDIPMVEKPSFDLGSQPSGPLPGQFGGHRGTPGLAIGDAILKGVMKGHEFKVQAKAKEAEAAVASNDAAENATYQKYQDALSQAKGDINDPAAKAAWLAYQGAYQKGTEIRSQYAIPEKEKKGKTGDGKKKDSGPQHPFKGIQDFFAANPHIIPQAAIASRAFTMRPQGLSRDTRMQNLDEKAAQQTVDQNEAIVKEQKQKQQDADDTRRIAEMGGIDKVIEDPKASPADKQAATRLKYLKLDKESPEGIMKDQLAQKFLSGQPLTPQETVMAGAFGILPKPEVVTQSLPNGHQQQVLVGPDNKPVPGSAPLDLGPSQWATQYYEKRDIQEQELRRAVEADPTAWGVQIGADPAANVAAVDARVQRLMVESDFGVRSLADQTGRTGYEIQRDAETIGGLLKELKMDPNGPKNQKPIMMDQPGTLTYPNGKTTAVGPGYMGAILKQFTLGQGQNFGTFAFRAQGPIGGVVNESNPDGKHSDVLEVERRFLYNYFFNYLTAQKGKSGMTPEMARMYLGQTVLGRPVIEGSGGLAAPPQAPSSSQGLQPPPQAGIAGPGDWTRGTNVTDQQLQQQ